MYMCHNLHNKNRLHDLLGIVIKVSSGEIKYEAIVALFISLSLYFKAFNKLTLKLMLT